MDDQWVKKNAEHTGQCGDGLFWWQAGGDLYIEEHGEICMDAFSWNSSIRNVKIAPGCTGIGMCAFHGCNLESVELPDGLERIDAYAFSVAAPLSLTIPDKGVGSFGLSSSFPSARRFSVFRSSVFLSSCSTSSDGLFLI